MPRFDFSNPVEKMPLQIFKKDGELFLPLPKGEGWGEGEGDINQPARPTIFLNMQIRARLPFALI